MIHGLFRPHVGRDSFADHATAVGQAAHTAAERVRTQNESIGMDVEKLFLVTQALWTLLKDQHGYSDEDLVQRVTELDLMDGKLDGKIEKNSERPDCTTCGRKLMARRNACMYCGATQPVDPFNR